MQISFNCDLNVLAAVVTEGTNQFEATLGTKMQHFTFGVHEVRRCSLSSFFNYMPFSQRLNPFSLFKGAVQHFGNADCER